MHHKTKIYNNHPIISVCIANFNGYKYVENCIDSVLKQRINCKVDIILHDDASTDDSVSFVRSRFPTVKIIDSKENVGFCVSNNRMILSSHAKYILLLNNDAVLRPNTLQSLLKHAESSKEPQVIGLPQYSISDGKLIDRGYEFDIFMNPIPSYVPGTRNISTVTGACLWIPRSIWDDVGGFPEWFESVAEDVFICQAARLLGYSITILDSPGFDHWIGRNLGGGKLINEQLISTAKRRALSERNKTYVMMVCYPWPLLIALMPIHFGFLAIEATALLATGVSWKKLKRIYFSLPESVLQNFSLVIKERKRIQSKRRIKFSAYLRHFYWLPWKLRMLMLYGIPKLN
ncbi:glycosyltransferase family 2 protein [Chromatium okenii]|jgi:GT2 family glycosyltransferase|uniref:glycosyltransferase family 2 protein n=1 Tax=Chromatium okenii TaxID=61644 RepID=UPI0026EF9328|nr:glycosyltransferase [Chromatium okenii]MBV5309714.1 glycosyltransferase [Chromatium okenii]